MSSQNATQLYQQLKEAWTKRDGERVKTLGAGLKVSNCHCHSLQLVTWDGMGWSTQRWEGEELGELDGVDYSAASGVNVSLDSPLHARCSSFTPGRDGAPELLFDLLQIRSQFS